mgnify:CR=1 FL=1
MTYLMFILGALLPLISLNSETGHDGADLFTRIAVCDIVALIMVAMIVLNRREMPRGFARLYLFGLVVALVIGLSRFANLNDGLSHTALEPVLAFCALLMAYMFLVIGVTAAQNPKLAKFLLAGVLVGVLAESTIVIHDYFISQQWFPDRMTHRVRGTFRASGQLAAFGFSASGLLLSQGWWRFDDPRVRRMMVVGGSLAVFFTIAASRRSAIASLLIWAAIFACLAFGNARTLKYTVVFVVVGLSACLGVVAVGGFEDSFIGGRIIHAYQSLQSEDNFIFHQFSDLVSRFWQWFPWGLGSGLGGVYDHEKGKSFEIHNGHLAIMVELGLLGFVSFIGLLANAIFSWKYVGGNSDRTVRIAVISFILASAIFMIHNRLHRERGFMLFMGMASVACAGMTRQSSSRLPGQYARLPAHHALPTRA